MTIIEDRLKALDSITLQRGSHDPNDDISPVLGVFVRALDHTLDDEARQALKPCIPRMIGTAGDGHDEERAWMEVDWLVRVCAPAWLELAGLKDSAEALRSLPPVTAATVNKAQPTVEAAQEKAVAAWDAARVAAEVTARGTVSAAAWAAAEAAACDAAWDAAGAADWHDVWTAAWEAAWVAARDAAWDAIWGVAWDTAWAAAGAAAWDVVGDTAWAAATEAKEQGGNYTAQCDAAYEAAKAKLDSEPLKARFAPLKAELHRSAHELLDRMIDGPFGKENQ